MVRVLATVMTPPPSAAPPVPALPPVLPPLPAAALPPPALPVTLLPVTGLSVGEVFPAAVEETLTPPPWAVLRC